MAKTPLGRPPKPASVPKKRSGAAKHKATPTPHQRRRLTMTALERERRAALRKLKSVRRRAAIASKLPEAAVTKTARDFSTDRVTTAERAAINDLFSEIPRQELADVLLRVDVDVAVEPKLASALTRFCELLDDPEHAGSDSKAPTTPWRLCRLAGLNPAQLIAMVLDAYRSEASLVAARGIPQVMKAVVDAAVDRVADCYVCGGSGFVIEQVLSEGGQVVDRRLKCRNCLLGKVRYPASFDAQRLAAEITGMTGKGVPQTAIQNNRYFFGQPPPRGALPPAPDDAAPNLVDWTRSSDAAFELRNEDSPDNSPDDPATVYEPVQETTPATEAETT